MRNRFVAVVIGLAMAFSSLTGQSQNPPIGSPLGPLFAPITPIPPESVKGLLRDSGKGVKSIHSDDRLKQHRQATVKANLAENPSFVIGPEFIERKDEEWFRDSVCVLRKVDAKHEGGTGTLVGENVVVTAGHAYIEGKPNGGISHVFVGLSLQDPAAGEYIEVTRAILHEKYKWDVQHRGTADEHVLIRNDLTLLVLKDAPSKLKAPPRALATAKQIDAAKTVKVVGFGANRLIDNLQPQGFGIKRSAWVTIVSHDCKADAPPREDVKNYGCCLGLELVASNLTSAEEEGKDICSGDSGGPAYIRDGDRYFLAGAVSRSTRPVENTMRTCGDGAVYVRIDCFKEWIHKTAAMHGGKGLPN